MWAFPLSEYTLNVTGWLAKSVWVSSFARSTYTDTVNEPPI